jgi:dTMP kinase
MKGYLISFEGIDCSGKSTQASLLHKRFLRSGRTAHLLREPGGTEIGEKIRSILLDPSLSDMSPYTELFLYLASRAQITSSVIIPALHRGEDIIMDRFIDSTVAYQGFARCLGMDEMMYLNRIATGGLVPDITFLIDCDPLLALSRLSSSPDRLEAEGVTFLEKVRDGFIALYKKSNNRIILCDGNRPVDVIESDIAQQFIEKFGSGIITF